MGSRQTRQRFTFDTEHVWTFTIYQNLVRVRLLMSDTETLRVSQA